MEQDKRYQSIGARPKAPKRPNPLNRVAQAGNQQQQPQQQEQNLVQREFAGIYEILSDWRLIHDLLGPIIEQKDAICWAIVLARLLEAIHNITTDDPALFVRISIKDLVKNIKKDSRNMEISSLKQCIKLISLHGIARSPDTSNANASMPAKIAWPFESKDAADRTFIEGRLALSPVGIIVDIDAEFEALRDGFYKIRVVAPDAKGKVIKHALMIVALGRTNVDQHFFIVQNSWKKTWGVNGYGRLIMEDDMKCVAFYPLR